MSFSNNFVVFFEGYPFGLIDDETVAFMCDEAQLPNVNTATGSTSGVYTGVGNVDYPHTRVFTELQLGFMLDANLSVLKFLNAWYGSIFVDTGNSDNRITRLNYRDSYAGSIIITKTESGPDSTTQRRPISYVLEKAYPYAIDAIPLQFGSSQVTKVTAQFKYQRHYTIDRDITSVKGRAVEQEFRTIRRAGSLAEAQRQTGALDLTRPYNGSTQPDSNLPGSFGGGIA